MYYHCLIIVHFEYEYTYLRLISVRQMQLVHHNMVTICIAFTKYIWCTSEFWNAKSLHGANTKISCNINQLAVKEKYLNRKNTTKIYAWNMTFPSGSLSHLKYDVQGKFMLHGRIKPCIKVFCREFTQLPFKYLDATHAWHVLSLLTELIFCAKIFYILDYSQESVV